LVIGAVAKIVVTVIGERSTGFIANLDPGVEKASLVKLAGK
jgi:hypothetical protein